MQTIIYHKITISGIFLTLIILFGQCANDKPKPKIKQLTKNIVLHKLSTDYFIDYDQLTDSTGLLAFINKSPNAVKMGDFLYFHTQSPFFVKKISISDTKDRQSPTAYHFKLYVNSKYKGKYKTGDTIFIGAKITSLNILFLKTLGEHIVEAWKGSTILKLIRQKRNTAIFKPKINLSISSKQKVKFRAYNNRPIHNKKTSRLNQLFIKKHFVKNQFHATGLYQDKKTSVTNQYALNFDQNGTFQIYQIISRKADKKLISEIFLTGNWRCSRFSKKQTVLSLTGCFSGYFANKKEKLVLNKQIRIKSKLNNIELKSDSLLAEIYFDFPNDALVDTKSLIPDITVEMPYAGTNNFTGIRLYPCNKCFLRYEVAKALANVQKKLKKRKMGLKLFDGYRPFSVQAIMFKKFPVPGYVADSIGGSVHNRGSAVDLTIIDQTGKELDMGTGFDELSRKANHTYLLFPDTVLKNRVFLKELMQSGNFSPIRSEWWHYNYVDGRKFPKINDDFLCD